MTKGVKEVIIKYSMDKRKNVKGNIIMGSKITEKSIR